MFLLSLKIRDHEEKILSKEGNFVRTIIFVSNVWKDLRVNLNLLVLNTISVIFVSHLFQILIIFTAFLL